MNPNDYHLRSNWRVLGTVPEVYELIARAEELPVWWPAAFLETLVLEPGAEDGLGRVVRLQSRGWLPLNFNWHLRVDDVEPPNRIGFHLWGDLEGRGLWQLAQDGDWTNVSFDWRVRVRKPVVRYLSYVNRRVLEWDYRWAMARGEESLHLELKRRHAGPELRVQLPPPPQRASSAPLLAAVGIAGLVGFLLLRVGLGQPRGGNSEAVQAQSSRL
jgi:hypothetical protein